MNKTLLSIAIVFSIFARKKDSKKEVGVEETLQEDITKDNIGIKQLRGEFIYFADAAVLQTPTEVYGVVIDSMMHVLESQVKEFKKEATDMVPVTVKGKVSAKPEGEEGWPYRVEILEVLKIDEPKADDNNVIKIEKQTK